MERHARLALFGVLLALVPSSASAQEGSDATGFGSRDSFVFSAENLLGFATTSVGEGDDSRSMDTLGMFPPYWGDIGLFSMSASGLSWGALVGGEQMAVADSGDITFFKLRPRIGWATSKNEKIGLWLRAGPSFMFVRTSDDDSSESSSAALLAVGFEAYVVVSPAPHVSILLGPRADKHLIGSASEGEDPTYTTYGLSLGLLGEIW